MGRKSRRSKQKASAPPPTPSVNDHFAFIGLSIHESASIFRFSHPLKLNEKSNPPLGFALSVHCLREGLNFDRHGCVDLGEPTLDNLGSRTSKLADRVINNALFFNDCIIKSGFDKAVESFASEANVMKATHATGPELFMLAAFLLNLKPRGLRVVEPRQVSGGMAVFCTTDAKVGHVLTTHPCEAVKLATEQDRRSHFWIRSNGQLITQHEASLLCAYSADVEFTRVGVAGDPDVYCPEACAHLIRDGGRLLKKDSSPRELASYRRDTCSKQNCVFVPLNGMMLLVVATRAIKAGEEVFASYGADFWKDNVDLL